MSDDKNDFVVPDWAGKPPTGLHLDVYKEDKVIQKLMVDEKKCYFFGRNRELNDFCIDHSSCSRVHAALLYHKYISKTYLIDLGSIHGTFIGNLRLEAHKPTPLPMDSSFSFGASTRRYAIRERPQVAVDSDLEKTLDLPETESELEVLTSYNTARNKNLELRGIDSTMKSAQKRKHRRNVSFNDEEEIINLEDVDPSVGRFRNLMISTVVPGKKMKLEGGLVPPGEYNFGASKNENNIKSGTSSFQTAFAEPQSAVGFFPSTPGIGFVNPAPSVEVEAMDQLQTDSPRDLEPSRGGTLKKKYVKESWPGRKPVPDIFSND